MSEPLAPGRRALALSLLGPVLVGAGLGLPLGARAMALQAAALPALLVGVALLMTPALYVLSASIGTAPPPRRFLSAAGRGLQALGTVLLGLGPAVLFLTASFPRPAPGLVLGVAAVALAAVHGLRTFFIGLYGGAPLAPRAVATFSAWALVCTGIGGRLLQASIGVAAGGM